MLPVLSATAAPGLQTRAQPLADLQIGLEESSLPRYSDMEFGYGDLEIVRGRAAIRRFHSAECFSFSIMLPVLSATAAPGLQTRAQPLADLQIGVEESSLPRYSDMEFGYGD